VKPSILKEHLQAVYTQNAKDAEALFRMKSARFLTRRTLSNHDFTSQKSTGLESSCRVALRIGEE
jgi:hypothetical protein